jgi:hypothetical protein
VSASLIRPRWLGQPFYVALDRVELLKWVALAAMLVDHVALYVFHDRPADGIAYAVGRLTFPLFVIAIAIGIARFREEAPQAAARAWRRLLWWAVIAQLASFPLRGLEFFNVLFTMALGVALFLVECAPWSRVVKVLAVVGVLCASLRVEFLLFGPLAVWAAIRWARLPTALNLAALVASTASLVIPNGNSVALVGLALAWLLALLPFGVRHVPRLFYWAYVVQFPLMWGASLWIA